MLIKPATTRECEKLFRQQVEQRGHRFEHYKKRWQKPSATLAVAQAANGNVSASTAITVNISTTAGSLLVLACSEGANTTSTLAITDTSGANTWVQAGAYVNQVGRMAMFYIANSAAITSVTGTWSGSISAGIDLVIFEITGAVLVNPLDPNSTNPVGSVTASNVATLASGALSTSNMLDILLYAVKVGGTAGAFTQGSGFTIPATGFSTGMAMQWKIVLAVQNAATTSMTWTNAKSNDIGLFGAFQGLPNLVDKDTVPGAGGQAINSSYSVPY